MQWAKVMTRVILSGKTRGWPDMDDFEGGGRRPWVKESKTSLDAENTKIDINNTERIGGTLIQ